MLARRALAEDALAIAEIQVESWRHAYAHIVNKQTLENLSAEAISALRADHIAKGEPKIWVVCDAEKILGYAIAGPPPPAHERLDFELRALYIRPYATGKGLGRSLMAAVVREQMEAGMQSMLLRAFRDNGPARQLYEQLGGSFLGEGLYTLDGWEYPDVSYGFSDFPLLLLRLVDVVTREVGPYDAISEITELLHRAYARNAKAGLRFNACDQDHTRTQERLNGGAGFVLERQGKIVGTLALCLFEGLPYGTYHPDGLVASCGQFAVEPDLQSLGLGALLLAAAETRAREAGATFLALDTAKPAAGLVAYYERRGFEIVGEVDYRPSTNYVSWVLSKRL